MSKTISVKYVHSPIGRDRSQKQTIRAFGFTRLGQIKDFPDSGAIRGMVNKVKHLVVVVK